MKYAYSIVLFILSVSLSHGQAGVKQYFSFKLLPGISKTVNKDRSFSFNNNRLQAVESFNFRMAAELQYHFSGFTTKKTRLSFATGIGTSFEKNYLALSNTSATFIQTKNILYLPFTLQLTMPRQKVSWLYQSGFSFGSPFTYQVADQNMQTKLSPFLQTWFNSVFINAGVEKNIGNAKIQLGVGVRNELFTLSRSPLYLRNGGFTLVLGLCF